MARLVKVYANLDSYKDRHGKQRYYYRKAGHKRIPIHGDFGSYEFDQSYEAAKQKTEGKIEVGRSSVVRGTINDLCARYYQTYDFKVLKPKTQKNYRRQIEPFREAVGFMMARALNRRHFEQIKADMVDRPGASRTLLKRLNTLLNFGVKEGLLDTNPLDHVDLPPEGDGFTPWTDDDITAFAQVWGAGTRERLGMYLCLFTGQRRSDIVKMNRDHLRDDTISVKQEKTGKRLWIPLHPLLQLELRHVPDSQHYFLINPRTGQALSSEGFGNWLRKAAKIVPQIEGTRGPHGLRKAAARRLIEAGCDGETTRAITGHASEKELLVYIRDVNQRKLARRGIDMLDPEKL